MLSACAHPLVRIIHTLPTAPGVAVPQDTLSRGTAGATRLGLHPGALHVSGMSLSSAARSPGTAGSVRMECGAGQTDHEALGPPTVLQHVFPGDLQWVVRC